MKRVHMVCNAHLDPVWLWEWEEGAGETLSTFRIAADFCEAENGFVFNHNEALLYQWIEEYDPALFARIQRLVDKGKWHIIGGWYLQPDCNLPSGESIIRQITWGRRYFQEKFHVFPTTAINFDSFGHSRGLVQLLQKSGYDSYLVCRPGNAKNLGESDFLWKGYDGSAVVVHYSDEGYNSVKGRAEEKLSAWLAKHEDEETGLFLWGIGNHGGGPSRRDIDQLGKRMREEKKMEILHSTPEAYFHERLSGCLPLKEYSGRLGPEMTGCYISQIRVKQEHRRLENLLYQTEKMLSAASLLGLLRYPAEELQKALETILSAEFHDTLPGSAIQPVEEGALRQLHCGQELAGRLRARAFFALAVGQPQASPGESPILVYNAYPYPIKQLVECELVLPEQNWEKNFIDPTVYVNGQPLPSQMETEASNFRLDWKKRVVFEADLAPFSMNRFDCRFQRIPARPSFTTRMEDGCFHFETSELKVSISGESGLLEKVEVNGQSMLVNACRPIVMRDTCDSWRCGYKDFDDMAGEFHLMNEDQAAIFSGIPGDRAGAVRVIEDGSVRTVVEALFTWGDSKLCQRYKLPKRGTEIEMETRVYWLEKDKMLKLAFPTEWEAGRYYGQDMFGREELSTDGTEQVSQQWNLIASNDGEKAILLINDSVYGSNCRQGELRVTLLRSAAYGASDFEGTPALLPGRLTDRMEQGERRFRFWLNSGSACSLLAQADRMAQIHNQNPFALSYCPSGGGELAKSLLEISDSHFLLSALMKSEQAECYIIRLYNTSNQAKSLSVHSEQLRVTAEFQFGAFEVKTLLLYQNEQVIVEGSLIDFPQAL